MNGVIVVDKTHETNIKMSMQFDAVEVMIWFSAKGGIPLRSQKSGECADNISKRRFTEFRSDLQVLPHCA